MAQLRAPSYLPPGYYYYATHAPERIGGFGLEWDVGSHTYAREHDRDQRPGLEVHVAKPGASSLAATETRQGVQIDLGLPHATTIYHDGMWDVGPGPDQRSFPPDIIMHWEGSEYHSITLRTAKATYGIRGSKRRGVDLDQLILIARSLA
jgi:hypothetical protein